MVTEAMQKFVDQMEYMSLYCSICEGEFNFEEALKIQGHDDYILLTEADNADEPHLFNLACPDPSCGHGPHLEVIVKVKK